MREGEATSLAQVAKPRHAVKVCNGEEGQDDLFLRVDDPELEEQLKKYDSPSIACIA